MFEVNIWSTPKR